MQYSISAAIVLALSSISLGAPLASGQIFQDIADAQTQWAADITKVSQFLSDAETLSPDELASQARQALATENDELTHKSVLDNQLIFVDNPNAAVQQANDELVNEGAFNSVVDGLQNLADNAPSMTPDQVSAAILAINEPRCSDFLPSVDTYFLATDELLGTGPVILATRPTNCL